jgi:hypothetical protein
MQSHEGHIRDEGRERIMSRLHPLAYYQDQNMRKFQAERFTEEEIDSMEHDIDTGNSVAYYWNYTVGNTEYVQRLDREKETITLTPAKEPIQ